MLCLTSVTLYCTEVVKRRIIKQCRKIVLQVLYFSDAENLGEIRMGHHDEIAKYRWGRLKLVIFDQYLAISW